MTADNDLIRRHEALAQIHAAMKRTYTPTRRVGYKQSFDIVRRLPAVESVTVVHSYWFVNAGWWFCHNCGGRSSDSRSTPYCPWCGAKMDALTEAEIE